MPFCPGCGLTYFSGADKCSHCGRSLPRAVPLSAWDRRILSVMSCVGAVGMGVWFGFWPPADFFSSDRSLLFRWCMGLLAGGVGGGILGAIVNLLMRTRAEHLEKVRFQRQSSDRKAKVRPPRKPWRLMSRLFLLAWIAGGAFFSYWYILRDVDRPTRWTGPDKRVLGLIFSPDSKRLFSSSEDDKLEAWDPSTGRQLYQLPFSREFNVRELAFSPDGRSVMTYRSMTREAFIWDVETGKETERIKLPALPQNLARPTPFWTKGGKRMVLGPAGAPGDNAIGVWDLETSQWLHRFNGALAGGNVPSLVGRGEFLITNNTKVWEVETGRECTVIKHSINGNLLSIAGQRALAWNNEKDEELVWHDLTGKTPARTCKGPFPKLADFALAPDGRRVLLATSEISWSTVRLWDMETNRELRHFRLDYLRLNAVAISPDGRLGAGSTLDKQMVVWTLAP